MSLQRARAGKLTLCQSDVAQGEIHQCVCIPWIVLDSNRFYFLVKKYFLTLKSFKKKTTLFICTNFQVFLLCTTFSIHTETQMNTQLDTGSKQGQRWPGHSPSLGCCITSSGRFCHLFPFGNGTYFQWSDLKILFVFSHLEIQWMYFRLTSKC